MISLQQIINEKEKEKRDFLITEKLKELEVNAEQNKILDLNACHKGFISSSSKLQFSASLITVGDDCLTSLYGMKGTDYFYEFFDYAIENNVKDMTELLNAVSPFLRKYFGVNVDYTNQYNREASFDIMGNQLAEIREKHGKQEYENYLNSWFDISIFKGRSYAECTEYAALTQNLYSFFGFETYYISGNYANEQTQESHAFNLLKLPGEKYFIIDNANPTIMYDENFNIISSIPRRYQITQEEFFNGVNGDGFNIQFSVNNLQKIGNNIRKIDVKDCVYGIGTNTQRKVV